MTTPTREQVIKWAQEAGMIVSDDWVQAGFVSDLARFARLVAQDFSEAYTEAVRMSPHISSVEFIRARYSLKD